MSFNRNRKLPCPILCRTSSCQFNSASAANLFPFPLNPFLDLHAIFLVKSLGAAIDLASLTIFSTPDVYVLCLSTEIANCHAQSYAERQAVNSTVQGSAADLVKKAMLGGLHVF